MTPRRPSDPSRGAGRSGRDGVSRRIVGRYRLDAELGRGAMGTVWRAYDEVLHRPVAVKEVRLSSVPVSERAVVRERTLREARATAMLSHPNVVTLYDVVEVDSEPYVVMELLPSRSLAAQIMEDGPLSAAEAAAVGSAVASALLTAHRAGITHRDVKPGNVLLGGPGQIKLTDFGIARNAAESSMTQTGTVLGSPPYIAPEVAMGRGVGPAADLWGLGATLFACVEGRPPYDAGNPVSTVSEVVHGDVPLPTGHGPVVDVIRGLMVKDPALRMPLGAVRRRLRPALLRPEDAGVPGVGGAPTGRSPAPPSPDSDHSGLIPIPRTHPVPESASEPLPDQPPTAPDTGPPTAASPEARADPSDSSDTPLPSAETGPAVGEGPGTADAAAAGEDLDVEAHRMGDELPADGKRADGKRADGERAGGERADGERADGERAEGERAEGERAEGERAEGANGAPAPQEDTEGAVRSGGEAEGGAESEGEAADAGPASPSDPGTPPDGPGSTAPGGASGGDDAGQADEGADVTARARALPVESPDVDAPPEDGEAGGAVDPGAAPHDAARVPAPGAAESHGAGDDRSATAEAAEAAGEDETPETGAGQDDRPDDEVGPDRPDADVPDTADEQDEDDEGDRPGDATPPDPTPLDPDPLDPTPPDATPPAPSLSDPTRVVAVPNAAARTTVTPRVGPDGPTRRVAHRSSGPPASPPPTPAAPWPSVPPPLRGAPPVRAGGTAPRAPGATPGLAPDPGPLPFTPRPGPARAPTRTVAVVVALLVALAVLGALIGYVLVRALGA